MKTTNKRAAYVGCLGMISIISTEFGVIGILPQLAEFYGINIDTAGYLLSAFALIIALTGPFIVLYTSRFDRKKMMLLAILIFVASNFLSALAPPYWVLILLRVLPSFLHPVFISISIATAIDNAAKEFQPRLMSIVIGGIAVAQVTIIPLSTYISGTFNWTASYIVQGTISLIATVAVYFLLPSTSLKVEKSIGLQTSILKYKPFILSIITNCLIIAAWFSTYGYFAEYLSKTRGLNEREISYMLFLFGVMGVISNFLAGKLLSKNLTNTTVLFLFGTILLPLLFTFSDKSIYTTAGIVCIWGIMYGPCFLTTLAYVLSAAPDAKEFANSIQISSGNLGVTLGTVVSGLFIGQYTATMAPWIGAAFGVTAMGFIFWRSLIEKRSATINISETLNDTTIHN
ncbi:Predicted arabinose efflux permease, MFS family [Dyadobacter koreensis]|uniref:Predicted arabinose efflux permease, MFS family n=1 Tax=Dyadobacter koreensis TaxID=408657 RepID=A0A1H6XAW0_9BACT|nr:MFS transporter [Dyadobacter koreensis]SEJ26303.1 Predicted arabinose efflux permease, MFS family [Dyadobacter koreensis]